MDKRNDGLPLDNDDAAIITRIAEAIAEAGVRAVIVGGSVCDHLLGRARSGDVGVELFGISASDAQLVLARFGDVQAVGRAFGVLRIKGLDVDFSLPRRSSVSGAARGDLGQADPQLDFAAAARRRDVTINAMGLDPLSGEVLDPLGGRADLASPQQ